MKQKKVWAAGGVLLLAVMGLIFVRSFRDVGDGNSPEETVENATYLSLSEADRQTADVYALLYETSAEEVAKLQEKTGDWEKTGKELEKDFFTIPENTKYQMTEDGYSLDDLEEAERLSVETGIRAMELIQAKGRISDHKSWSEVKAEKGIEE